MNIVRANEGAQYDAPGHFAGVFFAKQGDSAPGNKHLAVNLSRFKPGGGCDFAEFPKEWPINLCYYVIKGQLTVTTRNDKFTLREGDSVLWSAGDARGFVNEGDTETELLVIIGK
jgi:quercetin dioxygenase-like cupin family protein